MPGLFCPQSNKVKDLQASLLAKQKNELKNAFNSSACKPKCINSDYFVIEVNHYSQNSVSIVVNTYVDKRSLKATKHMIHIFLPGDVSVKHTMFVR